jgi:ABC-type multidrug transport system fused ATPase/permease subunit
VRAQELKTQDPEAADVITEASEESDSEQSDTVPLIKSLSKAKTKDSLTRLDRTKTKESVLDVIEEQLKNMPKKLWNFGRVLRMNWPEKWFTVAGSLGAMVEGATWPAFSLVFSEILAIYATPDKAQLRMDANFWSLMFLILAIVCFFSIFLRIGIFGVAAERLSRRLRSLSFRAMMRQEVDWYDREENGSGILAAKLTMEAQSAQELSGQLIGAVQGATALGVGVIIAFIYGYVILVVSHMCLGGSSHWSC